MLKNTFAACVTAALLVSTAGAQAAINTIGQPNAGYTGSTTLMPITVQDFSLVNSLSDSSLTISFSTNLGARTVPDTWGTWGSAPDIEGATPRILEVPGSSVTFTFDHALSIFGFEAEPNNFAFFTITAEFFDGATSLGTISLDVNGNAGARLFAAEALGIDEFTSVVVTSSDESFAVGRLRYALADATTDVPEPGTLVVFGSALAGLALARRRKTA